jgi:hypothetical protein
METYLLWQKIEEAQKAGKSEIMYHDGLEKIVVKIPKPTPRDAEYLYSKYR